MASLPSALSLMLALVSPGSWAQGPTAPASDGELKTALDAQPDAARGKLAYEACEGCHRKDGSGRANGTYPRLAGQHARVVIKQLVDIRSGHRHNPDMAPLVTEPVLNLQAMADIAAHVQGLPVAPTTARGPATTWRRTDHSTSATAPSATAPTAKVPLRTSCRWWPRSTIATCCANCSTSATARGAIRMPRWSR